LQPPNFRRRRALTLGDEDEDTLLLDLSSSNEGLTSESESGEADVSEEQVNVGNFLPTLSGTNLLVRLAEIRAEQKRELLSKDEEATRAERQKRRMARRMNEHSTLAAKKVAESVCELGEAESAGGEDIYCSDSECSSEDEAFTDGLLSMFAEEDEVIIEKGGGVCACAYCVYTSS
jgi:hypothetical protein